MKTTFCVPLAVLCCVSCSKDNRVQVRPPTAAEEYLGDRAPAPKPAEETTMSIHTFGTASNTLGFDLYRELGHGSGNLFFSPSSISLAFSMLYAGADGGTAEEMRDILHFPQGQDIHAAAGQVLNTFNQHSAPNTVTIANRLFGQNNYDFQPPFLALTKDAYGAELEQLDFTEPEPARNQINGWIREQTTGNISDLLPQGSIDGNTRLVLANAIYFLGRWAVAFAPKHTRDHSFHLSATRSRKVPMMTQTAVHRFGSSESAQILELAYKDSPLAMTLLLPNAKDGLPALEAQLTPENFATWTSSLRPQKVAVTIPRFEMTDVGIDLKALLQALGMKQVFSDQQSNLSKIANSPQPLYVSEAFHKAFVRVDEKGTEAAAASAVIVKTRSAMRHPKFVANHPFLFAIRDTQTGVLLFLGRVVDPHNPQ